MVGAAALSTETQKYRGIEVKDYRVRAQPSRGDSRAPRSGSRTEVGHPLLAEAVISDPLNAKDLTPYDKAEETGDFQPIPLRASFSGPNSLDIMAASDKANGGPEPIPQSREQGSCRPLVCSPWACSMPSDGWPKVYKLAGPVRHRQTKAAAADRPDLSRKRKGCRFPSQVDTAKADSGSR
jgi:hypothetical protein